MAVYNTRFLVCDFSNNDPASNIILAGPDLVFILFTLFGLTELPHVEAHILKSC